jgi:hypothetical protein
MFTFSRSRTTDVQTGREQFNSRLSHIILASFCFLLKKERRFRERENVSLRKRGEIFSQSEQTASLPESP